MTVCIAAISSFGEGDVIVGASDRMLTAGDIEFEPTLPKIYPITSSIVAMLAGDSPTQAEVLHEVDREIKKLLEEKPDRWLDVKEVAELYATCYKRRRSREAETAILAPLYLDANTFISRQREMDPSFIREIATELYNYRPPDTAAIITGLDTTGGHVFVVVNGSIDCNDHVGFASIGVGSGHANSQFMFAGYTLGRSYPETLMLTYASKKRSEAAPGVGEATDMFIIGTTLGSFKRIPASLIDRLEKTYQTMRDEIRTSRDKSEGEIREWFNEVIRKAEAQQQEQSRPEGDGETSSDSEGVRADAKESKRKDGKQPKETVH